MAMEDGKMKKRERFLVNRGGIVLVSLILNESNARSIAQSWLESLKFEEQLVINGAAEETPRSWVYATSFASGERGFGNLPVVVGKTDGRVKFCREADLEFFDNIGGFKLFMRFLYRCFKY